MKTASSADQINSPSNLGPIRLFLRRPKNAIGLLLLAAVAWGLILWWQTRYAPVMQHIDAGRNYQQQGQGTKAEQEWLKAVGLDPDNIIAWELLGDHYTTSSAWQKAVEAYRKVARSQPTTPQIYTRLATSQVQAGDIPAAQNSLGLALQHNPNDVDALYLLANMLAGSRLDDKLQLEYWRRLVKIQPNNFEYLNRTAELAIRLRQFEQARPLVEKMLKLDAASAPAYAMQGKITFHAESAPEALNRAEASFRKAIEIDPGDELSRLNLAKVHLRQGKPQQAVEQLESLDLRQPRTKAYLQDLARAYQQVGDTRKAAATRQRYATLQKLDSELGVLRAHVDRDAKDFNSTLQLGIKLMRSDNPDGAEKYLKKALELRPGSSEARAALSELERLYIDHMKKGRAALNTGNMIMAEWHLSQASLLRSTDGRAQAAVRQYVDQSGGTLPRALQDMARIDTR